MQNKNILIGVLAFALASTNTARADFGRAGTKAIDGNLDLAIGKSTETAPNGDEESTSIAAANVGGSYFVADSISVGARVALGYQAEEDIQRMTTVGLLLSGGYAHRLGERLHIWPQAGLGLSRSTITLGDWSASMVRLGLQIQVPLYCGARQQYERLSG